MLGARGVARPRQLNRYALTLMARHRLSISDPMFFEGPDGPNKVLVDGVGIIKGSPQRQVALESYLLSVVHPFVVDGDDVRQLIVTPRHVGDTLDDVINREPPVNVARVKPGYALNAGDTYDGSEFIGWAIGVIHPQRA
jgi:hypothetical protein